MKLLFEVRGRMIVRNGKPTINELHQAVKAALGKIVLFGEVVPYDIGTLMFNVQCVGEDVRRPNPQSWGHSEGLGSGHCAGVL